PPLFPYTTLFRSAAGPAPVIEPGHTFASITDKISTIVLTRRTPRGWFFGFAAAFAVMMMLFYAIAYLLIAGIGIWGINIPVGWGFAIINFVWWIGIGHAGTLISAILLLLRQQWRQSINRFAEAMTLFAVACAGLFPLLHLGRPFYFYWLVPYPNIMSLWPQFRSPLVWDVFAISTYFTISLLFWYVGLIPDLATLRDRSGNRVGRVVYGMLAMGWRGSARHWQRYEIAYLLLAGLATPLVVSVHTVVSFDFAVAIVPGWHSTIFPPFFVAGAIYSGFAMVMTLAIPPRAEERRPPLRGRPRRQRRDVARALHHRGDEPAPRLPAVVVGHVLPDALGLGDLHRDDGALRHPVPALHPLPPHDLDLRDAHDPPPGGGEGRRGMRRRTPIYGLLAEFDGPTELVDAA